MMNLGHMDWFEGLPLPVVSYSYGGFITFREDLESEHYFCSCMKEAIENYLSFYKVYSAYLPEGNEKWEELNPWYFPEKFVKYVNVYHSNDDSLKEMINFRDDLCHRCNKSTPHRTFRNSIKMPEFKKWHGWYIIIGYLESGVLPETFMYLPESINDDLKKVLGFKYEDLWDDLQRYDEIENLEENLIKSWLQELDLNLVKGEQRVIDKQYPENFVKVVDKAVDRRYTAVNRVIENRIRKDFNFRVMSGNWTNEENLIKLVQTLYPEHTLIQHYRPKYLEGLELDIFIKDLKCGIEYQGIQHYEAFDHLGGERALEKTVERDERKKTLCSNNEIRLIYFYYDEELTSELVEERLKGMKDDFSEIDEEVPKPIDDPHIMGLLKMAKDVNQ